MSRLGTLPSLRGSRNQLVAFGWFAVVIIAAYEAAGAIVAGDLTSLAFAAVLLVSGALVVTILNDWRRGLYVLVALICFEDLVRKYLGNNMVIFFAKDALAITLYVSFFRARLAQHIEKFRIPFGIPLLLYIGFGLLQVFNPASTSLFYGILGMKVDFFYVPLIYVGYALMDSEKDLRRLFSFTCVLILIVAALGLAQSIIGPTFLNPTHLQDDIIYLSTLYRTAPISGAIAYRPTSVFVSAGRFQDFLLVAWLLSLGYCGFLIFSGSRLGRTLGFTTVGVVAAASLMSASRGVFMWNGGIALVVAAGFFWGARWGQREMARVFRTIQRIALFVGIGIIVLLTLLPEELGSRLSIYSETLMPNSPTSELVHRMQTYPLQQLEYAFTFPRWPYGYGIGTCTLGFQYVIRILHTTPMNIGVESGFGNLILELGIVGVILWLVLGFSIAISAWKVVKELRGTRWFPLGFVIFLFSFMLFFPMTFVSFSAYQDYMINIYLWLLLGILWRLRIFSKTMQADYSQAVPRQN